MSLFFLLPPPLSCLLFYFSSQRIHVFLSASPSIPYFSMSVSVFPIWLDLAVFLLQEQLYDAAASFLVIDHLTLCSWASSAKIPSQKLTFF